MPPSTLTKRPMISADEHASLAHVPVGWRRRVVAVDEPARAELEREGLLPGTVVVVTSRTPLGGPVVVELGRARLALSASVAAQVGTAPYSERAPAAVTDRIDPS
ncbi:MAG: FeoA family protein [Candidatus Limnocylindrales bacterium]